MMMRYWQRSKSNYFSFAMRRRVQAVVLISHPPSDLILAYTHTSSHRSLSCSTDKSYRKGQTKKKEGSVFCPEKLSASSNDTTADGSPFKKQPIGIKLPARSLFPWRHSPYPLPRLIPGTPEFESLGGYMGPVSLLFRFLHCSTISFGQLF